MGPVQTLLSWFWVVWSENTGSRSVLPKWELSETAFYIVDDYFFIFGFGFWWFGLVWFGEKCFGS